MKTAVGLVLFVMVMTNVEAKDDKKSDKESGTNYFSWVVVPREIQNACSAAVAAARNRCAASCGTAGYTFYPGVCGTGSVCRCGGSTPGGPGGPGDEPEEP